MSININYHEDNHSGLHTGARRGSASHYRNAQHGLPYYLQVRSRRRRDDSERRWRHYDRSDTHRIRYRCGSTESGDDSGDTTDDSRSHSALYSTSAGLSLKAR